MKRWAECQTEQERRATFAEAADLCRGSVTAMAAVLGVERQHVYRLRERYAAGPADGGPTDEPVARVNLDLPRHCIDWLEQEALRRKQASGASRPAKSPIIVELIEAAMRLEARS